MASSCPGSSSVPDCLEQHLTCSICLQLFTNPVTSACGHTFCQDCLSCNATYNDRCPLCKKPPGSTRGSTLDVNIILKNLTEDLRQSKELNGLLKEKEELDTCAADEVPCDVCVGVGARRLKAQKSCLVCLASFCEAHLAGVHSAARLRGHKLVEPLDNLDQRACLTHGRPLEVYHRKESRCVCVLCMGEGDDVVSLEMEWEQRKSELDDTKRDLQQRINRREEKVKEISTSLSHLKDQLDGEWWSIEAVFTAVLKAVEDAQHGALRPLEEKRRAAEKEAKEITDDLQREVGELRKAIADLDDLSALEDHIHFLQTYQPPVQEVGRDWTTVAVDTTTSFGTMRTTMATMMERIQLELEKLTSIVDVKLDPSTAHTRLILSGGETRVRDGGESEEAAEARQQGFDVFASVLGLDSVNPDRSYWEVDVGAKTGWDLGVARGDANRKGRLLLNPDNGYWVTVHYDDEHYAAMTVPPTRLAPRERPRRVGVFVDRGEGLVSFYDVAAGSHVYSFTGCAFGGGELYPYLSPHLRRDAGGNAEPLAIVSPVKI